MARPALIVLALLVAIAVSTLSIDPALQDVEPSAKEAQSARLFIEQALDRAQGKKSVEVDASWQQVDALALLAGQMADMPRIATAHDDGRATVMFSQHVWPGLWLNGHLRASEEQHGQTRITGRLGKIPLSHAAMGTLYGLARSLWPRRKGQLPEWEALTSGLHIGETGVRAELDPDLVAALWHIDSFTDGPRDRATLVAARYCHLVELRQKKPTRSLVDILNRAFQSDEGRTNPEITIVALAMLARAPHAEMISGGVSPSQTPCGVVPGLFLAGRMDLAKHWTLSAALAANTQADVDAVGLWKEVADSDEGGSGFSYMDLAADMSGARAGKALASATGRRDMMDMLANVTDEVLLPVRGLTLEEGMSEAQFRSRYGGLEGQRHRATQAAIGQAIERSFDERMSRNLKATPSGNR